MKSKSLTTKAKRDLLGATNLNTAHFPLGSPESRAVARILVDRINKAAELGQYDADCLTLYQGDAHLNARTCPSPNDLATTAIYARGEQLHEERHGPAVLAPLDHHLQRSTIASLEFELAFGREPEAGDVLHYAVVERCHRALTPTAYKRFIESWQRQLPRMPCPLKIENERLFRRVNPRFNNGLDWEEAADEYPEAHWRHVEWDAFHHVLPDRGISGTTEHTSALTFLGVVDGEHRCRPATEAEISQSEGKRTRRQRVYT